MGGWGDPGTRPGVVTGSHLDSVPDGGAYDGPLGVASSFAAVELLARSGFRPAVPIGVANFVDGEGSRFGVACSGSRVLCGAMSAAVGSCIWAHGRWRFDLEGEANHAGTTRLADRRDPMLALAALITEARAVAAELGCVATVGKVVVRPHGGNAIPGSVSGWLDARGADEDVVRRVVPLLEERLGTAAVNESSTSDTRFDAPLASDLAEVLGGVPVSGTGAGHDAGVLATQGLRTAMLHVRNPTWVSHSPAEHADQADCEAGVGALVDVLRHLAG